jgi:hypothetical protein
MNARLKGSLSGVGIAWASAMLMSGCLFGTERKSQSPDRDPEGVIFGRVVLQDGSPVVSASVRFFPAGYKTWMDSTGPAFSTRTDDLGRYRAKGVEEGLYNILCEQKGEMASADSVTMGGDTAALPTLTLRPPGSVEGRVELPAYEDARAFHVEIAGFPYATAPARDGRFAFDSLPEGRFELLLSTSFPGYSGLRMPIDVLSGTRKTLGALQPPFFATSFVNGGIKADYDTLNGKVGLSWTPASREGTVFSYRVSSAPAEAPDSSENPLSDWRPDTTFSYVAWDMARLAEGPLEKSIRYRVAALGAEATPGPIVSEVGEIVVRMRRPNPARIHAALTIDSILQPPVYVGNPICCIGDSLQVGIRYDHPSRRIRKVEWFENGNPVPLHSRSDSLFYGSDSFVHIWGDDPGTVHHQSSPIGPGPSLRKVGLQALITDDASIVDTFRLDFEIWLDPVIAEAGPEQRVAVGDTVTLMGSARRRYAGVQGFEWDVGGTGTWVPAPEGKIQVTAPGRPTDSFLSILRATDSRGYTGLDTVKIRVDSVLPAIYPKHVSDIPFSPEILRRDVNGFGTGGGVVYVKGTTGYIDVNAIWFPEKAAWAGRDLYRYMSGCQDALFGLYASKIRRIFPEEGVGHPLVDPYRYWPLFASSCLDGKFYFAVTPTDVRFIDLSADTMHSIAAPPGLTDLNRFAVFQGKLLAMSGLETAAYDTSRDAWERLPSRSLSGPIAGTFTAQGRFECVLADGKMEVYDPAAGTWSPRSSLEDLGTAPLNVWEIGGKARALVREPSRLRLFTFDPETLVWSLDMDETMPSGTIWLAPMDRSIYSQVSNRLYRIDIP